MLLINNVRCGVLPQLLSLARTELDKLLDKQSSVLRYAKSGTNAQTIKLELVLALSDIGTKTVNQCWIEPLNRLFGSEIHTGLTSLGTTYFAQFGELGIELEAAYNKMCLDFWLSAKTQADSSIKLSANADVLSRMFPTLDKFVSLNENQAIKAFSEGVKEKRILKEISAAISILFEGLAHFSYPLLCVATYGGTDDLLRLSVKDSKYLVTDNPVFKSFQGPSALTQLVSNRKITALVDKVISIIPADNILMKSGDSYVDISKPVTLYDISVLKAKMNSISASIHALKRLIEMMENKDASLYNFINCCSLMTMGVALEPTDRKSVV